MVTENITTGYFWACVIRQDECGEEPIQPQLCGNAG